MPQFANVAYVDHTFCPVTTYTPPRFSARVRERREVAARVGLAEQLAPHVVARQHPRHPPPALVLGAVRHQRRADEADPGPSEQRRRVDRARAPGCRSRPGGPMRARPPYSTGQWIPTHRPACRVRCHSRSASASSGVVANSMATGGGCSANQARNSSRNASSADTGLPLTPREKNVTLLDRDRAIRHTRPGGPMTVADFSNVDLFRDPELPRDPYPFYEWVREHGPIWYYPLWNVYLVTGYDEVIVDLPRPEDVVELQHGERAVLPDVGAARRRRHHRHHRGAPRRAAVQRPAALVRPAQAHRAPRSPDAPHHAEAPQGERGVHVEARRRHHRRVHRPR